MFHSLRMCFSATSVQVPRIEELFSIYASTFAAAQQLGVVSLACYADTVLLLRPS